MGRVEIEPLGLMARLSHYSCYCSSACGCGLSSKVLSNGDSCDGVSSLNLATDDTFTADGPSASTGASNRSSSDACVAMNCAVIEPRGL